MVRAIRQMLHTPSFRDAMKAAQKPVAKVPSPKTDSNVVTVEMDILHPVIHDFLDAKADKEKAESNMKKAKATIVDVADGHRRRLTVQDGSLVTSVKIDGGDELAVTVTWANSYEKLVEKDVEKLRAILGDSFDEFFTRVETVSLRAPTDTSLTSEIFDLLAGHTPDRITGMTPEERFAAYFFVEVTYVATPVFHQERFLRLDAETLAQIEKIVSQKDPTCK